MPVKVATSLSVKPDLNNSKACFNLESSSLNRLFLPLYLPLSFANAIP